jgi:hypothetical protein
MEELLETIGKGGGGGSKLQLSPGGGIGGMGDPTGGRLSGEDDPGDRTALFDRIFGDPFRIKIVKIGPLPLPIAVPGPGWLPLGGAALLLDAVRPMTGVWAPIQPFAVTVEVGLSSAQQPLRVVVPVPLIASSYLFTGSSVGEIYIKLTVVGVIWPVVLAIDLLIPIIAAIVAVITIGATSPALIINALANFLTEFVSNIFKMVMNFIMSLLCLLFGKKDTVCAQCGCQKF